jgi:hypothetical protein
VRRLWLEFETPPAYRMALTLAHGARALSAVLRLRLMSEGIEPHPQRSGTALLAARSLRSTRSYVASSMLPPSDRNNGCCSPLRRLTIRRQLVAALPPSPFTAITCPSMILFLGAFYVLHAVFMAIVHVTSPPQQQREQTQQKLTLGCSLSVEFAWRILEIAAALVAMHLLGTLPNLLRNHIASGTAPSSESGQPPQRTARLPSTKHQPSTPASSSPSLLFLCCTQSISQRRTIPLVSSALLTLLHQAAWIALLAFHLLLNWSTYRSIDSHLTASKNLQMLLVSDPMEAAREGLPSPTMEKALLSPHAELCGSVRSIHLLRWSLVCLCVTTALVLSLGVVVAQDGLAAVKAAASDLRAARQARRAARAAAAQASPRHTAGSASAGEDPSTWLDMQTDEVDIDLAEDEDDPALKL